MSLKTLWKHLRLYDLLAIGYLLGTAALVASSAQIIPIRERLVISHLAVAILIVGLVYWTEKRGQTQRHNIALWWVRLFRDWHPLFWFSFLLFGEFTYLVRLFFPFAIEKYLIAFDFWLFGQPPHQFIQHYVPWWGVELMAFAYWSYYPLVIGITWYYHSSRPVISRRKSAVQFSFVDFMNRLCFSFYICYLLFMLIPARSPRHALNLTGQLQLEGGFFYHLIATMQNYVSVVGAAFPSSHVTVTWVATLTLWEHQRRTFWILFPLVIALTFSIFVLQYHYILDAIGGVLIAFIFEWFWRRFYFSHAAFVKSNIKAAPADQVPANSLT